MAVSAVVAVTSAVSYESSRKQRSAQKRAAKKQERVVAQEQERKQAQEKQQRAREEKLEAAKAGAGGTAAQQRIAAERSYLRKGRRGRMASIKSQTTLG